MGKLKHFIALVLLVSGTVYFVQAAGGYLAGCLSNLEKDEELRIDEKVIKQMVLQLEPQEYYTIQLGSYADAASGQDKIDVLAQAGYRVFVTDGPPYQLWIGCIGKAPSLDDLPDVFWSVGTDVFVQKQILNRVLFQFPADASTALQDITIFLASVDIVLKHSLQMFQDYRYDSCSEENWNEMITQVLSELEQIQSSASDILLRSENELLVGDLLDLLTVMKSYHESLQLIIEKKNTEMVFLAQSCLLELIDYYHEFIEQNSIIVSS